MVAAPDEAPDRHPGGRAGLDAARAVLDHQRLGGGDLHPRGREKEEVGRGFSTRHHLCGEDALAEERRKPGQLERVGDTVDIAR